MPAFLLDLKLALRSLLKSPAFTVAAVLTLALGIGASTAMFSAINSLLLRPLPFHEADRLVDFSESRDGARSGRFSHANFFDYRDRAARFQDMAAYAPGTAELTGWGAPQSLETGQVSAGYLELLGQRPVVGRFFSRDQEVKGNDNVVVLSQGLWQRLYAGDPRAVGQSLFLGGQAHTILGVAPASAILLMDGSKDLYRPLVNDPENRGSHSLRAVGRLKPGVSAQEARQELRAIAAALAVQYPDSNGRYTAYLQDLHTEMVGDGRKPMLLLMGAVGVLLLIACTNVASLFLVRASSRRHDVAVRVALGASRGQLVAQYLAEGLLVSSAGAVLGLLVARFILIVLPGFLPSIGGLSGTLRLPLDGATLLFALAGAVATGLLFGLVPAFQARGLDIQSLLRSGGRGASARHAGLRSAFVVGEVAMAVLLLLASGLLLHSFVKVLNTSPGFELQHLVTFTLDLPDSRYHQEVQVAGFHRELSRRLATLPGVDSVGLATFPPMSQASMSTTFHIGATTESVSLWPTTRIDVVDSGYFRTLRAPILQGRDLDPFDRAGGKPVVVVNEAFAKQFFPGRSPLGSQLEIGFASEAVPSRSLWEIVGVVSDFRDVSLERGAVPKLFGPVAQLPFTETCALLRTRASAKALAGAIREQVAAMDGNLAVAHVRELEDLARERLGDRSQTLILLGTFAGLALLLAGIGIYGLLAFSVAQRTREMGIRMALGARTGQILTLIMGQGLKLVAIGVAAGLLGFFLLGRVLAHQLYQVDLLDPWTLVAVPFLLGGVAMAACLAPTLRAARVDPVVALRND